MFDDIDDRADAAWGTTGELLVNPLSLSRRPGENGQTEVSSLNEPGHELRSFLQLSKHNATLGRYARFSGAQVKDHANEPCAAGMFGDVIRVIVWQRRHRFTGKVWIQSFTPLFEVLMELPSREGKARCSAQATMHENRITCWQGLRAELVGATIGEAEHPNRKPGELKVATFAEPKVACLQITLRHLAIVLRAGLAFGSQGSGKAAENGFGGVNGTAEPRRTQHLTRRHPESSDMHQNSLVALGQSHVRHVAHQIS